MAIDDTQYTELFNSTLYKRLFCLTALVALATLFWGLGEVALLSFNEARRALPAREMYASSDWLLPHLNGELYITKPPFLYWLQTTFALVIGHVNEWTVRLPSALAALSVFVMVYVFCNRTMGRWQALFAVQILLANTSFTMFARRAEIEMLLTALCLASLLSAIWYIRYAQEKRWLYLSYAFLALALLTKGPLVLLLVTLPLLILAIMEKSPKNWEYFKSIKAWLIFLVIGLSWYLAVSLKLGFDIWSAVAHKDLASKMAGEGSKPLLSYIAWIAVDFLPVILILLIKPKQWLTYIRGHSGIKAVAIGVIVPLLVFSLFSNKHAKYLLPIYPLIAIILSGYLAMIMADIKLAYKKILVGLCMLIPAGFMMFYGLVEARVYSYRTAIFPEFSSWVSTIKVDKLYAYKDMDERMFFYSAKPITVLAEDEVRDTIAANHSLVLLIEAGQESALADVAHCRMAEFKPYLKRGKVLEAIGFGDVCAKSPE